MSKSRFTAVLLTLLLIAGGCGQQDPAAGSGPDGAANSEAAGMEQTGTAENAEGGKEMANNGAVTNGRLPEERNCKNLQVYTGTPIGTSQQNVIYL